MARFKRRRLIAGTIVVSVLVIVSILIAALIVARAVGWDGTYLQGMRPSGTVITLGHSGASVTVPQGWQASVASQVPLARWLGFEPWLGPHAALILPDGRDGRELTVTWGSSLKDWSTTSRSSRLIHLEPSPDMQAAGVRMMFLNIPQEANSAQAGFSDAYVLVDDSTGRYSLTVCEGQAVGDDH